MTMQSKVQMDSRPGPTFVARNDDHVPFNKKRWEVNDCSATLKVVDYDGKSASNPKAWLDIQLDETQVYENGRSQTRTITFCLDGDGRRQLIEMLGGRL